MRALEIFAAARLRKNAGEAGHRSVGVENDRDLAAPEQGSADRAGAGGELGDVAAIDQLHRRRRDPAAADAHRQQDERDRRGARRAADQAEAAIAGMPGQQFDLGIGQALDRPGIRRDGLHRHARRGARRCGNREEQPAAIGRKPLRLDDRPGPGRGADIEVGHFLVALRDLGQHRRVVAKRRIDVPARQVALDRRRAAVGSGGIEQQ